MRITRKRQKAYVILKAAVRSPKNYGARGSAATAELPRISMDLASDLLRVHGHLSRRLREIRMVNPGAQMLNVEQLN
jgi:hypothetical protein